MCETWHASSAVATRSRDCLNYNKLIFVYMRVQCKSGSGDELVHGWVHRLHNLTSKWTEYKKKTFYLSYSPYICFARLYDGYYGLLLLLLVFFLPVQYLYLIICSTLLTVHYRWLYSYTYFACAMVWAHMCAVNLPHNIPTYTVFVCSSRHGCMRSWSTMLT